MITDLTDLVDSHCIARRGSLAQLQILPSYPDCISIFQIIIIIIKTIHINIHELFLTLVVTGGHWEPGPRPVGADSGEPPPPLQDTKAVDSHLKPDSGPPPGTEITVANVRSS